MTGLEKKYQLQTLIENTLTPLINRDYWLLEVPYYTNLGDTLIWQGELDFLRKLPYKCKGMCSYETPVPDGIGINDIILLQGGGNFGDLWTNPHEYRMRVIEKYPNNKIIIFPQTVWFENENNMASCAKSLAKIPNLTICARDTLSYNILKNNFKNHLLLVPDMAFCMDTKKWKKSVEINDVLLLKREDKELNVTGELKRLESESNITITDWPTFKERCWQKKWFSRVKKYIPFLYDWYARYIFRPYLINSGIKLISSHKKLYSTRLHAAILSILLGKAEELSWFDNSYGKNSSFYETWLKDVDGITFVK